MILEDITFTNEYPKPIIYDIDPAALWWEFYACPPSGGEEELDFIPSASFGSAQDKSLRASINYDIKYRMGKESLNHDS